MMLFETQLLFNKKHIMVHYITREFDFILIMVNSKSALQKIYKKKFTSTILQRSNRLYLYLDYHNLQHNIFHKIVFHSQ